MDFATSTNAPGRDPFMPQPPRVRGRAITLAVLAHVLLILAIAFGVNWRADAPPTVAAELWSATPQAAAPRAVEPPPTPTPEVRKPEPVVKPTPTPPAPTPTPTPALPDPQIAIEKAKREEAKRIAAEQEQQQKKLKREQAEREKEALALQKEKEREKEREKAERLKAEQAKAEKAEKAEAAKQAAAREAYLKRMQGMVGATGADSDTGTALRSSAPSDAYGGRIAARIKPNIVFTEPIDGNPRAVVELRLAPDGGIASKRLVQSSGVKAWDEAVLRAIERTETFPLDNGRVPPPITIGFRPRD